MSDSLIQRLYEIAPDMTEEKLDELQAAMYWMAMGHQISVAALPFEVRLGSVFFRVQIPPRRALIGYEVHLSVRDILPFVPRGVR